MFVLGRRSLTWCRIGIRVFLHHVLPCGWKWKNHQAKSSSHTPRVRKHPSHHRRIDSHQSLSANNTSTLFSFRPINPFLLFHAFHCARNELRALLYGRVCELVGREPKVGRRVFTCGKTRKMCVKAVDCFLSDEVCWCVRKNTFSYRPFQSGCEVVLYPKSPHYYDSLLIYYSLH